MTKVLKSPSDALLPPPPASALILQVIEHKNKSREGKAAADV